MPPPAAAPKRCDDALEAEACRLLLAFLRLPRSSRPGAPPGGLKALLSSGAVAPRHLAAFTVVALLGPMTVSELAESEGLALSTASLVVTQLAEAGLVERHEDTLDRRRTVVSVAAGHRREATELIASRLAPMRRALARLGPRRAAGLFEALEVLGEEFARGEATGGGTRLEETGALPSRRGRPGSLAGGGREQGRLAAP